MVEPAEMKILFKYKLAAVEAAVKEFRSDALTA